MRLTTLSQFYHRYGQFPVYPSSLHQVQVLSESLVPLISARKLMYGRPMMIFSESAAPILGKALSRP